MAISGKERRNKIKIFLVAGGMGVGKSTFSLELAKRYRIKNIFCTDIIRSLLKSALKDKIFFKHSFQLDNAGFKKQSLLVSCYVEQLLREFVKLGKDSIIEGINIWPSYFTKRGYEVILIDINDERVHKKFIASRKNDTYKNFPQPVYMKNFDNIRRIRGLLLEDALTVKCRIIDESSNFKLR